MRHERDTETGRRARARARVPEFLDKDRKTTNDDAGAAVGIDFSPEAYRPVQLT